MRVRKVRLVALSIFATAAAGGRLLHAQSPSQERNAANPELAAALQALRPGHLVRISTGGVRDTGRVALASSSQLSLRRRPDRDAVPASSIDSLWTWKSNAGGGALWGAIAGVAVGVFMGTAVSRLAESTGSSPNPSGRAFGGGVAGGLVGALLGVSIGARFSRWELVHPRRPRAP